MAGKEAVKHEMTDDDIEGTDAVKASQQADDEGAGGLEIEVVDDAPEEDRGREPMPKKIVKELEQDELEEYSAEVKSKLKQLKKVWHDERREKERLQREQAEAVNLTRQIMEENKRLKSTLSSGEGELLKTYKTAAELSLAAAQRDLRDAHESGDSEKLAAAQQRLASATYQLERVRSYRPTLQPTETPVPSREQVNGAVQRPPPDPKRDAWLAKNPWFGSNPAMSGHALGLHTELVTKHGAQYANTDEYWDQIDADMRRRYPDYFDEEQEEDTEPQQKSARPAAPRTQPKKPVVVAPASRSTASKKIRLTASQVALAKRLGLTPEQYASGYLKEYGDQ